MMTLPARQAFVAYRLRGLGYPLVVAMRVAMTPPIAVSVPAEEPDDRPGRDLAVAVLQLTPHVIRTLIRSARFEP